MKDIRTLNASEIDCRIGQVSQKTKKVSILLYKNARVDMAILDELVGPENWQRDHKEIKGNLYCGVGINTAAGWVWKWDCGTESNTEPEKGESSDSFKRACVNWGIGRELYTAPEIWLKPTDKEWNDGKPWLNLTVATIKYNDAREIVALYIVDENLESRYSFGMKPSMKAEKAPAVPSPAPQAQQSIPEPSGSVPGLTKAQYTALVKAAAEGRTSKSGIPVRDAFIMEVKPTQVQLDDFDADVFAWRLDHNINIEKEALHV